MMRKLLVAVIAVAVFLITPYFLLNPPYWFGEAELRAAVEDTWTLELVPDEGPRERFAFKIEQARSAPHAARDRGWIRPASACGHRTFIRSAEACLDGSELALTLTALGRHRPASLRGSFHVTGTTFKTGRLQLAIDGLAVRARISPAGEVLEVNASRVQISPAGEVLEVNASSGEAPRLRRILPLLPDGC